MRTFFILFILLINFMESYCQEASKAISAVQVVEIIKQYHPVGKQADIIIEKAKADIVIAKGGFDPLLYSSNAQKTFDGTDYYQYNRPELTIPAWFGVEVHAGLEKLSGSRTDPTETIGKTSYLGFSMPLAKNLLMDKRRAALQTAKIFRQASEIERRHILNNLVLDAMKSYWYWMQYYLSYKILNDAVRVNEKRLQLVKAAFLLGDRPAIDTTEALTQLQNFQMLRENAWMELQNARLELSVFLWQQNDMPAELPADAIPADELMLTTISAVPPAELSYFLESAKSNHPELLLYDFKLEALKVNKKLKFQGLLPTVNFRYNQLGKGYDILKTANASLLENNFQYRVALGIPLRLSEGRGEYRKAKLKIAETQLQQNLKRVEVENKVRAYYNELTALKKQVEVQENACKNYRTLQQGEEIRFQAGESSLFLINARENKTLEALLKLQELRIKYLVAENALKWAAGLLVL